MGIGSLVSGLGAASGGFGEAMRSIMGQRQDQQQLDDLDNYRTTALAQDQQQFQAGQQMQKLDLEEAGRARRVAEQQRRDTLRMERQRMKVDEARDRAALRERANRDSTGRAEVVAARLAELGPPPVFLPTEFQDHRTYAAARQMWDTERLRILKLNGFDSEDDVYRRLGGRGERLSDNPGGIPQTPVDFHRERVKINSMIPPAETDRR